ncbi:MAG TPA: hydroxyphenylacetyl-CoA thioesterase PaaI [Candidatus Limnocylindria bacterium]|nr:hydroxyphenylacetyl-CoA thioesterase PaaI [Candidatus Limnocylindria bacterium]
MTVAHVLQGDALARACAEAMFARDAASRALGMTIEEARAGYARVAMRVTAEMVNGHGSAHGGMTYSLADSAFAFACNSRNEPHVALQCSISYTAPVLLGDLLVAEAEERSSKGRTGVYDVTVTRGEGEVVAIFRGVCYRIKGTVLEGSGT